MEKVWERGGGVVDIPAAQVRRSTLCLVCRAACSGFLHATFSGQDNPLPSQPSPSFTLHTGNMQLLCYGGKPSVRSARFVPSAPAFIISHARPLHTAARRARL